MQPNQHPLYPTQGSHSNINQMPITSATPNATSRTPYPGVQQAYQAGQAIFSSMPPAPGQGGYFPPVAKTPAQQPIGFNPPGHFPPVVRASAQPYPILPSSIPQPHYPQQLPGPMARQVSQIPPGHVGRGSGHLHPAPRDRL